MDDFDVTGAVWIDVQRLGSLYEEQIDGSRVRGHVRHRLRAEGPDTPHRPWIEGRAPDAVPAEPVQRS